MSVRINESGQDDAAAEVHLFCPPRAAKAFDAPPPAHGRNPVVANEQRAIANDSEFGERPPAPRHRPAQRQQF